MVPSPSYRKSALKEDNSQSFIQIRTQLYKTRERKPCGCPSKKKKENGQTNTKRLGNTD